MLNLTPAFSLFASYRGSKLNRSNPVETQARTLLSLVRKAEKTKFGIQHGFSSIRTVSDFQRNVPLRRYEDFWQSYWKDAYPVLENVTWPGTVPFFALSSGTTSGTTKYIPITREMISSNTRAGLDMLSYHVLQNPTGNLFGGLNFMLGGSTELQEVSSGIFGGDLSGISVKTMPWWILARYFPPKELALLKDWEQKIDRLAHESLKVDIRMISGVPSWLLIFFKKLFEITGKEKIHEVYPNLELLVHGGVNFTPYYKQFAALAEGSKISMREVYPASEGFIGVADRGFGDGLRLGLDHGIFFEFIPVSELDNPQPTRHWIKDVELDVNYAVVLSSCAGLWSYILGDTVKFVDIKVPRVLVTGRTSYSLSAFGEHVIAEEVEKALAKACKAFENLSISDYTVGAIFPEKPGDLGGHQYFIECDNASYENQHTLDPVRFSEIVDAELCRLNEDYEAHRAKGFGLNPPKIKFVTPGTFAAWMKSRGKLGGQHKVPRLISDKALFEHVTAFIDAA